MTKPLQNDCMVSIWGEELVHSNELENLEIWNCLQK